MKISYLSALAALAAALTLAGCGGKASFDVSVVIDPTLPLTNSGLVLANNDGDLLSIPARATGATFSHRVSYGDNYNITVQHPADHMTCVITNGSGSAGHTATVTAIVSCTQNANLLSGAVLKLKGKATTDTTTGVTTGTNLILTNGTAQLGPIVPSTDGSNVAISFGNIPDGTSYGITVLSQPTGQTCTVENGVGVMHDKAVDNVTVTCAP